MGWENRRFDPPKKREVAGHSTATGGPRRGIGPLFSGQKTFKTEKGSQSRQRRNSRPIVTAPEKLKHRTGTA